MAETCTFGLRHIGIHFHLTEDGVVGPDFVFAGDDGISLVVSTDEHREMSERFRAFIGGPEAEARRWVEVRMARHEREEALARHWDFSTSHAGYEGGRFIVTSCDGTLGFLYETESLDEVAAVIGELVSEIDAFTGWFDLDEEQPIRRSASWKFSVSLEDEEGSAEGTTFG